MKTYKTIQGDTWDLIAKKEMGSEYHMTTLMEANTDKIATRIFKSGEVLNIPNISTAQAVKITPPWRKL